MDSLVVLVPVLGRPGNVRPLVESWEACGAPGTLLFLVQLLDRDEIDAIDAVDGDWCDVDGVSWPDKLNDYIANPRYDLRDPDWFLLAADDVEFEPGWWDATEKLRADPKIGVIGTNDCANPRVIAGEHATHWLMRRSYIEEFGTVDEPGKAVHGGYHHWFVDDECHWTAKSRDAWAFCPEAIIRHKHPYFDDGVVWDSTYALGESRAEEDQALFRSRAHLFGLELG